MITQPRPEVPVIHPDVILPFLCEKHYCKDPTAAGFRLTKQGPFYLDKLLLIWFHIEMIPVENREQQLKEVSCQAEMMIGKVFQLKGKT